MRNVIVAILAFGTLSISAARIGQDFEIEEVGVKPSAGYYIVVKTDRNTTGCSCAAKRSFYWDNSVPYAKEMYASALAALSSSRSVRLYWEQSHCITTGGNTFPKLDGIKVFE
jgi:hypothetical protein